MTKLELKVACPEHSEQNTSLYNAKPSADIGATLTSAVKSILFLLRLSLGMMDCLVTLD